MSAVTVPAEFGEPYMVKREGNRLVVSRRHESGYLHTLIFRSDEFLSVCNAGIDLLEPSQRNE